MTLVRRAASIGLAALLACATLEFGSWMGVPGIASPVAPAEAVVGRPLTPVSVAGVGRRTVRRCAAGVYYC
jgi:hypothetical protein